jgi:TRAP-type C4-dicarboxylate transport system substrate-binding protein
MTDLPLVAGVGATIINNSCLGRLSEKHKQLVQEITEKYHRQIIVKIRQSNEESIDVLKNQGIEVISVPHQEKLKWKQIAGRVRTRFLGELYEKKLLEEVDTLKSEYQKNK